MKMRKSLILVMVLSLLIGLTGSGQASWYGLEGMYSDSAVLFSTPEEYEEETGNQVGNYNEAPILKEMVENGEIDTIKERLPKEPAVFLPAESIGNYGGTIKRTWAGPSDHWGLRKLIGERFVTGGPDGLIYPNVAKSWEIIDEGKAYIFHLREGMKWSDGAPVTADDAMFWWEINTDTDLEGPPHSTFRVGGETAKWEKLDDYSFKITFAEPNATFLEFLASEGRARLLAPKHYLKQYYPRYNSEEEVKKLVEEAGYDSWQQLFDFKFQWPDKNPDRPVITAWYSTNDPSSTYFELKRNPYYWKVDTEGNQLPYIDEMVHEIVTDPEMVVMRAISGEIDFQGRGFVFSDYPLLMENRDKGGYEVMALDTPDGGTTIYLNTTLQDDEVKRELFDNDKFRKALSLAVNREEINDMYSFGQGVVRQSAFPQASPFYDNEWAKAYAKFNIDQANKMLDELGLEKGEDGIREMSDSRDLTINLLDSDGMNVPVLELVKGYWDQIGVELLINTPERSLFETRLENGNYEALVWHFDSRDRPDIMAKGWSPDGNNRWAAPWGPQYSIWLQTDGEQGIEPPAGVKRMNEILKELPEVTDFEKRKELMAEVSKFHREQLYLIGLSGPVPAVFVYDENLGNVTEFPRGVFSRDVGLSFPQQIYYKNQ
ncbi:peptide/nickel transport system substrate-binding protein [Halanaerobium saccharolyticum]|uniref:Peptide/nickel transport system substrate-binding protein n=1 Tax=Halanaerobium saccharolyticum TaxID=43595 RepID=A0A4R7Z2T6_9FIRM|nr:ABC transporter substrate-binding protein [Halanaerobium saccharolyticum]RAK07838.1 peptide/nickel transport system substrate-binding protein [Halanaerobium saccharolyticum]TDW04452.1 peptide/nickel transport system substrate-binding protein [Halanaerobium saccharolyticum]TDX59788.1 peptide/nickel transport system substrate-binding protein [Halanaerobium saccharolyticum]